MYIDIGDLFKAIGLALLIMVIAGCFIFTLKIAAEPDYRHDFCEARG